MVNRRDFLKTAAVVGGSGLLGAFDVQAAPKRTPRKLSVDYQTYMPRLFDGKSFGPGELTALEDEAGIDRFVVIPEATILPDNSGLAKRIGSHPRMIGCAGVNPTFGPDSVAELERAVKVLGFRGVRLFPVAHGYPVDSEIVFPLLEKARELGIPVTIDGDADSCKPSQVAAIAGRFPEVPFIMDTGFRAPVRPPGEPAGLEMKEVMGKCPNLYLGLTALTTCQPAYLMSAIWVGGPERVVFGSFAPSGIPLLAVKGIEWAGLEPKAEALIFGETLRKLYKLG